MSGFSFNLYEKEPVTVISRSLLQPHALSVRKQQTQWHDTVCECFDNII